MLDNFIRKSVEFIQSKTTDLEGDRLDNLVKTIKIIIFVIVLILILILGVKILWK